MITRSFLLIAVLFSGLHLRAQYYFKDLVTNRQLQADMNSYRDNKVHAVTLKSYDDDGSESPGFFCEKKISRDFKRTEVFTRADIAPASAFTSLFSEDGKVLQTTDSSAISVTRISYRYDDKGRVANIVSTVYSKDEDFETGITEQHVYQYDNAGLPVKMFRVKNTNDTSEVDFAKDDRGNIGIEKDTKSGAVYYYYYDSKRRLTDIVPGDARAARLKPDYMFEYNSAGQLAQMTSVQQGTSNYFIWKYSYDNGLRSVDRCYSDEKKLMGSIQYVYR